MPLPVLRPLAGYLVTKCPFAPFHFFGYLLFKHQHAEMFGNMIRIAILHARRLPAHKMPLRVRA
jgi:hypothetical protein